MTLAGHAPPLEDPLDATGQDRHAIGVNGRASRARKPFPVQPASGISPTPPGAGRYRLVCGHWIPPRRTAIALPFPSGRAERR